MRHKLLSKLLLLVLVFNWSPLSNSYVFTTEAKYARTLSELRGVMNSSTYIRLIHDSSTDIPSANSSIAYYFSYNGYTNIMSHTATGAATVHGYFATAKLIHICGHGFPGGIHCYNGTSISAQGSSTSTNKPLSSYGSSGLTNVKFAFFSGCKTARWDSTFGDLDDYAYYTLGIHGTLAFYSNVYYTTGNSYVGLPLYNKLVYDYLLYDNYTLTEATAAARLGVIQAGNDDAGTYSIRIHGSFSLS